MGNLSLTLLHSCLGLHDVQHFTKIWCQWLWSHVFANAQHQRIFVPTHYVTMQNGYHISKISNGRHLSRHPRCQQLHRRKPYINDEHPSSSPSHNQGVMVYQLLPSDFGWSTQMEVTLSPEKGQLKSTKTVTRNNLTTWYIICLDFTLFFGIQETNTVRISPFSLRRVSPNDLQTSRSLNICRSSSWPRWHGSVYKRKPVCMRSSCLELAEIYPKTDFPFRCWIFRLATCQLITAYRQKHHEMLKIVKVS